MIGLVFLIMVSVGSAGADESRATHPPLQELPIATEAGGAALRLTAERYARFMSAVYHQTVGRNLVSESRTAYDTLIADGPPSSLIYTRRAALRFEALQDVRGAEADCRQALALNPENVHATWLLARLLIQRTFATQRRQANPMQTELGTVLKRVVELDADHVDGQWYLGQIASEFGETALAIAAFKALTRIEPFQARFHERLAELYEAEGQTPQALQAYQRVVTIQPGNVRVRNHLGLLYVQAGDYERAVAAFGTVLEAINDAAAHGPVSGELAATELDAHFGIGLAYQWVDDLDTAVFHLTKALGLTLEKTRQTRNRAERAELKARLTEVRYALGQVYLRFEQPQQALDTFDKLLAADENHVGALYGSGSAHQTLGSLKQAETYFRKVLTLAPGHPDASNALGYLYAEQGIHLEEAAALVQRALKVSPTSGAYLDSLGFIYLKQGQVADAIELLELADRHLPATPEILGHLGDAYLEKGLKEKAVQTLERAVQVAPEGSDIAVELREKLEALK